MTALFFEVVIGVLPFAGQFRPTWIKGGGGECAGARNSRGKLFARFGR